MFRLDGSKVLLLGGRNRYSYGRLVSEELVFQLYLFVCFSFHLGVLSHVTIPLLYCGVLTTHRTTSSTVLNRSLRLDVGETLFLGVEDCRLGTTMYYRHALLVFL